MSRLVIFTVLSVCAVWLCGVSSTNTDDLTHWSALKSADFCESGTKRKVCQARHIPVESSKQNIIFRHSVSNDSLLNCGSLSITIELWQSLIQLKERRPITEVMWCRCGGTQWQAKLVAYKKTKFNVVNSTIGCTELPTSDDIVRIWTLKVDDIGVYVEHNGQTVFTWLLELLPTTVKLRRKLVGSMGFLGEHKELRFFLRYKFVSVNKTLVVGRVSSSSSAASCQPGEILTFCEVLSGIVENKLLTNGVRMEYNSGIWSCIAYVGLTASVQALATCEVLVTITEPCNHKNSTNIHTTLSSVGYEPKVTCPNANTIERCVFYSNSTQQLSSSNLDLINTDASLDHSLTSCSIACFSDGELCNGVQCTCEIAISCSMIPDEDEYIETKCPTCTLRDDCGTKLCVRLVTNGIPTCYLFAETLVLWLQSGNYSGSVYMTKAILQKKAPTFGHNSAITDESLYQDYLRNEIQTVVMSSLQSNAATTIVQSEGHSRLLTTITKDNTDKMLKAVKESILTISSALANILETEVTTNLTVVTTTAARLLYSINKLIRGIQMQSRSVPGSGTSQDYKNQWVSGYHGGQNDVNKTTWAGTFFRELRDLHEKLVGMLRCDC